MRGTLNRQDLPSAVPSHSLSRTVTPSQEVSNNQMEEDDILSTISASEPEKETPETPSAPTGIKPKEQRHDKKKQLSHIPAADLGLVVYAPQTKSFPGSKTSK